MTLRIRILFLFGLLAPLAAPAEDAASPASVAVTLPVLRDWVEQVAGDHVRVHTLLGENADVHHFDPVPADIRKLAGAAAVYQIGLGLEPWLDSMIHAAGKPIRRIRLADGLSRLPAGEDAHSGHHHGHHEHGHDHHDHGTPWDPHIWMDPLRASYMIISISETLAEILPEHAETFQDRADAYIVEIGRARARAGALIREIPTERRQLILQHNNLAYFAERFDMRVVATVQGNISTEFFDPSARAVAELVALIRREGIPAIFPDYGDNPDLMRQIAREAGVALAPPLYVSRFDAAPDGPVRGYTDMLLHNARVMRDALAPRP